MKPSVVAVLSFLLIPATVAAEEPAGCEKFAWSLKREQGWFAVSDKPTIAAGGTLETVPGTAFVVRLQPGGGAKFALPPERTSKLERWFGGMVSFPAPPRAGLYQITLSDEAWIDVVQAGTYAKSIGNTGRRDCPILRKSVRFQLLQIPFSLQLSGATSDVITVAISPSE